MNSAEEIDKASEKEERNGKEKCQNEAYKENTLHSRRRFLEDVTRNLTSIAQPWGRRFVNFTIDAEWTSLQRQLALSDCIARCSSLEGQPDVLA